jgi:hypothetical protein
MLESHLILFFLHCVSSCVCFPFLCYLLPFCALCWCFVSLSFAFVLCVVLLFVVASLHPCVHVIYNFIPLYINFVIKSLNIITQAMRTALNIQ